jgi:hypothetical protein
VTLSLAGALALALLPLAPGPVPAGKKPKESTPPPVYYPLKVGNTWDYRLGQRKLTARVTGEETIGKDKYAILETSGDGKTVVEKVAVLADGIYRAYADGMSITPPLRILKLPVKAGESWTVKSGAGGLGVDGTFTAAEVEVKLPAGTYKAVSASCPEFRIGTRKMALTYWFAPGVGLVKQRLQVGERDVVIELEKFNAAK